MAWLKWSPLHDEPATSSKANGIEFPAGKWVEVVAPEGDGGKPLRHMIEKARTNRFFEVSDVRPPMPGRKPAEA